MQINHNIPAFLANSNLNKANTKVETSLERLSSGYRINKAADDAAGMAIAQKMHAQIVGLQRASRNSADGVSMIQTAEGALTETENILQRMRELSVQAANGTNTLEDRESIQREIDALKEEVDRLANETEFNTKKLLDGSCSRLSTTNNPGVSMLSVSDSVALGAYSVTVTSVATKSSFTATMSAGFSTVTSTMEGNVYINGEAVEITAGQTLEEVYTSIRDLGNKVGVDVTPINAGGDEVAIDAAISLSFSSKEYGSSEMVEVKCDNSDLSAALGITGGITTLGNDAKVSLGGGFEVTATAKGEGTKVVVSDRSGFEMVMDTTGAAVGDTANLQVLDAGQVVLQVGANEGQEIEITIPAVTCEALSITRVNVNTQDNASAAITTIDEAIGQISSIRAKLGAYQNRLESAVKSLDTSALNLTESVSGIEDTDMAEEMANYTQYNVLSQAGTAMLAQANNRPQQILQLLQG